MNAQHNDREDLIRALDWLHNSASVHLRQDTAIGKELAKQALEHALDRAWEILQATKGERE